MNRVFLAAFIIYVLRPMDFIPGLTGAPLVQLTLLAGLFLWFKSDVKQSVYFPLALTCWFALVAGVSMGVNGWWGGVVYAFSTLMPAIVMFMLAASATRDLADFERFVWVLITCCAIIVFHSYQQVTTGSGFTGEILIEGRVRYIGVFNDPNDLGCLFVLGYVGTGYLFIVRKSLLVRLLLVLVGAAIVYGVLLTESRGTLLACLAASACLGVRRFGIGRSIAAAAVILPILWGATRLATVSNEEESAEGRIDAWYQGFQMLISDPVFGVGFSNFTEHNYLTAHNSFVLVLAETGVVGYSLWFVFCGYCVRGVYRAAELRRKDSNPDLLAARAVLLMCVGFIVAIFFLSRSYTALLFIVCGLALARSLAGVSAGAQVEPPPRRLAPLWYSALGSIPVLFLITKILLTA